MNLNSTVKQLNYKGPVAQLVERRIRIAEITGSNPVGSTKDACIRTIMKAKIGLITLGVSNLKKSLRFYRDGLGFPTQDYKEDSDIVFFKMEGSWLALYPKDKLAEDATVSPKGNGFPGFTIAHNVKTKEEVDNVIQIAIKAGAKLVKQPQDVFWGGYSGYFADPDGYLWEVAYNPFTDLT